VTKNVGVGLYLSLMGTFSIPYLVLFIRSSFDFVEKEDHVSMIQSFKTNYLYDRWVLLNPSDMRDDCLYPEIALLLSAVEISYQVIQQNTVDIDSSHVEEVDPLIQPVWVVNSFASRDCLDMVLPTDEAILEALTWPEKPWEDLHHISFFLPYIDRIEGGEFHLPFPECVD